MDKRRAFSAKLGTRAKAVHLLIREEVKSDKRQAVADALTDKLVAKYAKKDPTFASSIASMTNRLLLHSQKRVMEADIVALETIVKKMSMERQNLQQVEGKLGSHSGRGNKEEAVGSVSSSKSQVAPKSPATGLAGLEEKDEWVLLNALTQVEFESDQEKEKTKALEKKKMQKAWLDAQHQEKIKCQRLEKKLEKEEFEHQLRDFSKWQKEESDKVQRQQELLTKVRCERDEQLRRQKRTIEEREAKRKQDEAGEVERVQAELKRQEIEARHRRETEHTRMKRLQTENSLVQKQKSLVKLHEHQEDVELMEAYARRLEKEDEERMRRLQTNLRQRDQRMEIAEGFQTQMKQKALEDERRAVEYQKLKNEADLVVQVQKEDARRNEALERQEFLRQQRAQKKHRERQEIEDDLTFARRYHSEGQAAIEAQHCQVRDARHRNKSFQKKLIQQMAEQRRNQPRSSMHLPRTPMDHREKSLNAKLLQKLEDPEISQKVLKILSPAKETPAIPTTFY